MWIAKNAKTGTTYGKSYDSIYDCQKFIDCELKILEYEMQKCFALELKTIADIDDNGKSFFEILSCGIKELENTNGVQCLKHVLEMSLLGKSQKEIDSYITDMSMAEWQSNNIIRCYNVGQKRFADGFDF